METREQEQAREYLFFGVEVSRREGLATRWVMTIVFGLVDR